MMTSTPSKSLLFLFGLSASLLLGCDEQSGSCDPAKLHPEGWSYNLRIYNCVEGGDGVVMVNDRPIGDLPGYDSAKNECPYVDFGSFPMCDDGTIQVDSGVAESVVVQWTADAVDDPNQHNGCWLELIYLGGLGYIPPDAELQTADPALTASDLCDTQYIEGIEEATYP